MKPSGSKTGSKIKIQADNTYSAINEVSYYNINFIKICLRFEAVLIKFILLYRLNDLKNCKRLRSHLQTV